MIPVYCVKSVVVVLRTTTTNHVTVVLPCRFVCKVHSALSELLHWLYAFLTRTQQAISRVLSLISFHIFNENNARMNALLFLSIRGEDQGGCPSSHLTTRSLLLSCSIFKLALALMRMSSGKFSKHGNENILFLKWQRISSVKNRSEATRSSDGWQ